MQIKKKPTAAPIAFPRMVSSALVAFLFFYVLAAFFAFRSMRFYFWFPDWILESLVRPFWVEAPRGLTFFIFQIPGFIVDIFHPFSLPVFETKKTLLNATLSFYPVIGIIISSTLLYRRGRPDLLIFPLIAFGLLYPYSALPTFNGSQHAFFFFWILVCFPSSRSTSISTVGVELLYSVLFVLFIFCYPPFSFLGSIVLCIRAHRMGQSFRFLLGSAGVLRFGIHLLFLNQFFPNQSYVETVSSFLETWGRPHFSFVCFTLLSLGTILVGKNFKDSKQIPLFAVFFAISALLFWIFDVYYHPHDLLKLQYPHRIFFYSVSSLLGTWMVFSEKLASSPRLKKSDILLNRLSWSLTFFILLTGLISDVRASSQFITLRQLIKTSASGVKGSCKVVEAANFDRYGVAPWEYPYHSIFNWDEMNQTLIVPAETSSRFRTKQNYRILDQYLGEICKSPGPHPLEQILTRLRNYLMEDKANDFLSIFTGTSNFSQN